MQVNSNTIRVRDVVRQTFTELGEVADIVVRETILLVDSIYSGRRFVASKWQAVWLAGEAKIVFSNDDGDVFEMPICLDEQGEPLQRAA
jgi:hypothetical protein